MARIASALHSLKYFEAAVHSFSQQRAFSIAQAFSKQAPYICPGQNRKEFATGLKASGVNREDATDRIPLSFHKLRKAIHPSSCIGERFDGLKEDNTDLLRTVATRCNESTFVSRM